MKNNDQQRCSIKIQSYVYSSIMQKILLAKALSGIVLITTGFAKIIHQKWNTQPQLTCTCSFVFMPKKSSLLSWHIYHSQYMVIASMDCLMHIYVSILNQSLSYLKSLAPLCFKVIVILCLLCTMRLVAIFCYITSTVNHLGMCHLYLLTHCWKCYCQLCAAAIAGYKDL